MSKSGRTSPYERPSMLPKAEVAEFVYRNQHPLHTGKRGKLYSRYDFVTPILDAMSILNAQRSIQDWKDDDPLLVQRPKKTGLDALVNGQAKDAASASAVQRFQCVGCGNEDESKLTPSADRDAMVCECGVVCFTMRISQHREKNCTEDEDKTTHAERPREATTDRFDSPPPTAEEARRTREREAQNVHYSQRIATNKALGMRRKSSTARRPRRRRSGKSFRSKTSSASGKFWQSSSRSFKSAIPWTSKSSATCAFNPIPRGTRRVVTWNAAVRPAAVSSTSRSRAPPFWPRQPCTVRCSSCSTSEWNSMASRSCTLKSSTKSLPPTWPDRKCRLHSARCSRKWQS